MRQRNRVEFQVTGNYALFANPITQAGGEICSYQVPTYEALKSILSSIYWKPTLIWYIDKVRVMNRIQTEVMGVRPIRSQSGKNDLACRTYLKNCRYQVQAHFEWNENRPDLADDRNEHRHHNLARRMIEEVGRRDVYLGTRECRGYVEPCYFDEEPGAYDRLPELSFGLMYHGITYADEAYSDETRGKITVRFWRPVMKRGIIAFPRPEDCPLIKSLREMDSKRFCGEAGYFSGLRESREVD